MKASDVLQLSLPTQKKLGAPHLWVRLNAEAPVAIAMPAVQAVVTIPTQRITPMPNMPKHILGLVNRRSQVLWVIDLSKMLGLAALNLRRPELHIVILEVDQQQLAFAVPHIEGVMRFMPEEVISPLGNFSAELVPYLQGWLPHEHETLLVLSARSLVTSPLAPATP